LEDNNAHNSAHSQSYYKIKEQNSNDEEPKEENEDDEYECVEEYYDLGDGWDEGEQSTEEDDDEEEDAEEEGKDEEQDLNKTMKETWPLVQTVGGLDPKAMSAAIVSIS